MRRFNIFSSVIPELSNVKKFKDARNVGLIEARDLAKADALHTKLTDMRHRIGGYQDYTADDVVNELLDILIDGIDLS